MPRRDRVGVTLTKALLSTLLAEQVGDLTLRQSAEAVADTFEIIKATLERGENVLLTGFGKFTVRDKHARIGRNPKTRKPITIAARRVVRFQASVKMKAAVNR